MVGMNKQDWYEDRILWRAEQHKLFEKRCVRFPELPAEQRELIQSGLSLEGNPVLVFFRDDATWTLLTTAEIVTCHGGEVFRGQLDEIQKDVGLWSEAEPQPDDKHTANYLALNNLGFKVWAPEGKELHALWSILKMFPITGVPA